MLKYISALRGQLSSTGPDGWALLLTGISYWANVIRTAPHEDTEGLSAVPRGVIQNGAFGMAAWMLIAVWAARMGSSERIPPGRVVLTVVIGLIGLVPSRQATIVMLAILGLEQWHSARTDAGQKIAALLIVLAIDMIWVSPYIEPIHAIFAILDASLVRGLLFITGTLAAAHLNIVDNATTGVSIEILARCSSSYQFGGVCLAFVVTELFFGKFPGRNDVPWLLRSLLASIALTELRLAWMTAGEQTFTWLHDGDGVTLYTFAAAILAMLFPILALRRPIVVEGH
jgi:hypothetical protein